MPRDLFGTVTRPFAGAGARSRFTVPLSLAAHTAVLAAVVITPLIATDALPSLRERLQLSIVTPVVPPEPPRPLLRGAPPDAAPPMNPNAAPLDAPTGVAPESATVFEPWAPDPLGPGIIAGDVVMGAELLAPPPEPPVVRRPVRAGFGVTAPLKVHDVAPLYPAIAQAARVQGVVIVQATIGVDGAVVDARVLRSVPLLDDAALDAVRQWRYTPTRLNGEPVAVVMTVTVRFQLG